MHNILSYTIFNGRLFFGAALKLIPATFCMELYWSTILTWYKNEIIKNENFNAIELQIRPDIAYNNLLNK